MTARSRPDFAALEQRIVDELRVALATLAETPPAEPLAALVLYADPYKGWYSVHVDTAARNAAGARARNVEYLAMAVDLITDDDAWQSAMTYTRRLSALPFDPRYGEYSGCDDPAHEFEIPFTDFVRSPAYAELNVGGEDGWLEGHVRFVITRAFARLVAERAFDALPRAAQLCVGYAYPDSIDAIMVAIVDR
jgi:hypothetical protein